MGYSMDRAGARCTLIECQATLDEALAAHPLLSKPDLLENRARLFKALGDPTRLRILGLLSVRELCLCELVDALQVAESTLVHHLRMLEEGGLLTSRRDGKFTYFRGNAGLVARHRALDAE
jgi:DNA-binding transcriptional ArsR family regulator